MLEELSSQLDEMDLSDYAENLGDDVPADWLQLSRRRRTALPDGMLGVTEEQRTQLLDVALPEGMGEGDLLLVRATTVAACLLAWRPAPCPSLGRQSGPAHLTVARGCGLRSPHQTASSWRSRYRPA